MSGGTICIVNDFELSSVHKYLGPNVKVMFGEIGNFYATQKCLLSFVIKLVWNGIDTQLHHFVQKTKMQT